MALATFDVLKKFIRLIVYLHGKQHVIQAYLMGVYFGMLKSYISDNTKWS